MWTRRLLLGANSVLLVKHPTIAFSTFVATRSIQPPPLISLFSSSRRSLSTTTAACSPPLHPHSDIGKHIKSPQSWGLNSSFFFFFIIIHSVFFFFGVRVGNGAVNAAAAAAIPLESPKMLLKGMSYTELEVCI